MELFIVVGIITFYAVIWTRISNVVCDALSPDAKKLAVWLMKVALIPVGIAWGLAQILWATVLANPVMRLWYKVRRKTVPSQYARHTRKLLS